MALGHVAGSAGEVELLTQRFRSPKLRAQSEVAAERPIVSSGPAIPVTITRVATSIFTYSSEAHQIPPCDVSRAR